MSSQNSNENFSQGSLFDFSQIDHFIQQDETKEDIQDDANDAFENFTAAGIEFEG